MPLGEELEKLWNYPLCSINKKPKSKLIRQSQQRSVGTALSQRQNMTGLLGPIDAPGKMLRLMNYLHCWKNVRNRSIKSEVMMAWKCEKVQNNCMKNSWILCLYPIFFRSHYISIMKVVAFKTYWNVCYQNIFTDLNT